MGDTDRIFRLIIRGPSLGPTEACIFFLAGPLNFLATAVLEDLIGGKLNFLGDLYDSIIFYNDGSRIVYRKVHRLFNGRCMGSRASYSRILQPLSDYDSA